MTELLVMLKSCFYTVNRKQVALGILTFLTTSLYFYRNIYLKLFVCLFGFFLVGVYEMFRIHQESDSADAALQIMYLRVVRARHAPWICCQQLLAWN